MLSKLLSKTDCALCKYCCEFDKDDAWEFPLFNETEVKELRFLFPDVGFESLENGYYSVILSSEPLMVCPFLSREKGCLLPEELKPFDCKIWPLRVMRKEKTAVLVLEPYCNIINRYSIEELRQFAIESGITERAKEYALNESPKLKEYRDEFEIVIRLMSQ